MSWRDSAVAGYRSEMSLSTGSQNVAIGKEAVARVNPHYSNQYLRQAVGDQDYGILATGDKIARSSVKSEGHAPRKPLRFRVAAPPTVTKHDAQGIALAIIVAGLVTLLTVGARYII